MRNFFLSVLFCYNLPSPFSFTEGHAVAQLIEALRYKPEGRRFDSRCHWNFSLTYSFLSVLFCYNLPSPFSFTEGHAVAQLIEALRYKPEGRRFDSRWCH